MGYELHITRQENWFDEDAQREITMKEWTDYVSLDLEMRLDNYAEIELPDRKVLRTEEEGISVWEKYSRNGENQNFAWFYYSSGNICVKNSDQEIINKMVDIAGALGAKVQGDECELYKKEDYLDANLKTVRGNLASSPKAWWKFW